MFLGLGMLEDLEASSCMSMRDEEIRILSEATDPRSLKRVAVRNIHGNDISDEALLALARAYPLVEELLITGDALGCTAVTDLFLESLSAQGLFPCLRLLNLRGCYSITPQ